MIWFLGTATMLWLGTGFFWALTRKDLDPIGLFFLLILGAAATVATTIYFGAALWNHALW